MADETSPAAVDRDSEFNRLRYLVPYILFVIANAGTSRASLSERPIAFWIFAACAVLGVLTTAGCLKSMRNSLGSRSDGQHRPAFWLDFWGILLVLYGLYVILSVLNHAS
ncbi:cell envelope integrity protein CreD [Streptomyces kanamyceticus]|uniref:Uncharacterized protein n=1 Tax=Streptomyces kanamyceticus TaxID=1967 RepID=A0A5J6GIL2_STRKN|nr:cell envelope integrity protein CreD [Streptomyces kanamyceticus]QEU92966.1 hypothetical protein CP970_20450 [Streptomyces kanamyceticus]